MKDLFNFFIKNITVNLLCLWRCRKNASSCISRL